MLVGWECLPDEALVAVKVECSEHDFFFCLVFQRPPEVHLQLMSI